MNCMCGVVHGTMKNKNLPERFVLLTRIDRGTAGIWLFSRPVFFFVCGEQGSIGQLLSRAIVKTTKDLVPLV
jgi:hypothetical protein